MIRGYDITVTYLYGNHSIASTFLSRRLQIYPNILQNPKLYPIWYHSIAASRNIHVFAKICFYIYSSFLAISYAQTETAWSFSIVFYISFPWCLLYSWP